MKTTAKMSGEDRRTAIIRAARRVFVEKGFYRTTTRELADAAGVSEALLFKHFPNKEALYSAIQMSCFKAEGSKVQERLEALEPSTSALVFMVRDLVSHVLEEEPLTKTRRAIRPCQNCPRAANRRRGQCNFRETLPWNSYDLKTSAKRTIWAKLKSQCCVASRFPFTKAKCWR